MIKGYIVGIIGMDTNLWRSWRENTEGSQFTQKGDNWY